MAKSRKPDLRPVPDPEVRDRPKRRRFTAKYKLAILREVDACTELGAIAAVLRREGLYSSHLANWRRAREAGELQGLTAKQRGRPRRSRNPLEPENEELRRENARLQEELRKTRAIIEFQKKACEMLDIVTAQPNGSEE